ncbi:hypothetical protein [Streptomyces sp. NPDC059271]|uniref:hypothetical protein n=1 Tax=Streptomyces sp. NPDC059271 TaxID=3346799 RepID=UPI00367428C5
MGWPPALRELKDLLYQVYLAAGAPSLDAITGDIADDDGLDGAPSRDTVRRIVSDPVQPQSQADVIAVARVLARRAAWDAPDLAKRVRGLWVQALMAQGAGRPIGDLRGDVRLVLDGGLGVHPAWDTGDAHDRFGLLPTYIPRDHDAHLKTVVDAAKDGRSGIAILVGGSSTGKTHALWEAVRTLPDGWRLWHPLTPTAPDAALAALPDIAPKTVVWLNETQHYLDPDPLGEQVAAGLRELLNDSSRAPVLVLGTLWPEHWDTLTTRTLDRHPGARALLGGHKIDVPKAFTPGHLAALDATGNPDPRLAQAARHADDGQVAQYLAGVPYLMDRYHAAEGATRALIHAAMDARRLGAGLHVPLDWLADAAPGYLTDTEYHALDADWLSLSLAYVTAPCNGIPGILTSVSTGGPRNQRTRRRPDDSPQGPQYMLADYLDQHGRHHRAETIPPIDFWTAAAAHAHHADLTALGTAAWDRGLYRDAAQLHKRATTHGSPHAAEHLVNNLHTLHPGDPHPAQWAAAYAPLDNPRAIARLLKVLRKVGAHEQATTLAQRATVHASLDNPAAVTGLLEALWEGGAHDQATALLARNPAKHASLDDPRAVAKLLKVLWEGGAHDQATALLARNPAKHASLDDPYDIAKLLKVLWEGGAHEQATALLVRSPATHASLDNLHDVAWLLEALWEGGARKQATALAERAAVNASVNDPYDVARLLKVLQEGGAHEQAATLAERATAHASLNNPGVGAGLLEALWEAGAHGQATALAERAAVQASLDKPYEVAGLLKMLWECGAHKQAAALAERTTVHTSVDDPYDIARLLKVLRECGAPELVTALGERAVVHASLENPGAVARLLNVLREGGAHQQVSTLLARNPAAHASLDNPSSVAWLLETLWECGAHQQAAALAERLPAAPASLDDPRAFARLLEALQDAGAHEQATALAERAAGHASLDNPGACAGLLEALWDAGAPEQATALAERATAQTFLDDPYGVAQLLEALWKRGVREQATALLARNPATHAALYNPRAVTQLLKALREAGAHEQARVLTERLPAAGHFDLFITFGGGEHLRLGREPDGGATPSWAWSDVD